MLRRARRAAQENAAARGAMLCSGVLTPALIRLSSFIGFGMVQSGNCGWQCFCLLLLERVFPQEEGHRPYPPGRRNLQ